MIPPTVSQLLRGAVRRPGFALTAILLLALGAGANAAVFSVVRGVLLRPLPYPQPERLVMVRPDIFITNEDLVYFRERTRSFREIAAQSPGWMMSLVAEGAEPIKVTGARTSGNFFATLRVEAALGRTILPDDAMPGRSRILVLSASLHEQQFGGDPSVIGRRVRLDNVEHEIVGVMPRGFEFLEPGTDVWAPVPLDPSLPQHRTQYGAPFARLHDGVTLEQAERELHALLPAMRADLKKTDDWGRDLSVISLQEAVVGDVRPTLLILLAAVGLILLLAALNLGTLVLGRSIERAGELAVRTALGASRGRLMRQLAGEQALLACADASAGLLLARLGLPILVSNIPPEVPRQSEIALDLVVFASVLGGTVLVSLVMALLPVAIAARPEIQPLLRQSRGTETPARRRALTTLVAGQVALAVVLGIGAGLMLRTLWNLQRVDPGFDPDSVLTFRLQTTSRPMNLARGLTYFEEVLERVRAIPGVASVGAIQHLPMTGYNWMAQVWRPEEPPAPGAEPPRAAWRFIGWDYLETMRIPLVAGRSFTPQDTTSSPPVAIVNEAFARREFGGAAQAIGRRVVSVAGRGEELTEIVGVIRDVRFMSLAQAPTAEMYRPLAQTFMFPMAFVVRTSGPPASIAAAVRQAAFGVDPTIAVAELQPLAALVEGSLGRQRLLALLLSVFAAAGLALSIVGVYGVVAYRVRQQHREFGICLALGAAPHGIVGRVLRQGAAYAIAGLVIGLPAAFVLARLMDAVVFGVTTHDPVTFATLPLTVAATTLLACLAPALRAARVDPASALK